MYERQTLLRDTGSRTHGPAASKPAAHASRSTSKTQTWQGSGVRQAGRGRKTKQRGCSLERLTQL